MNTASHHPAIHVATEQDLGELHAWLQEEQRQGVHGNFFCNWNVIQSHQRSQQVLLYTDPASQEQAAYLAGGLCQDTILQVRNAYRRRGIGRILVEHALSACLAQDRRILVIECAPSTSVPFWERLGFTPVGNHAHRVLPLIHDLPHDGRAVNIAIRFYTEERRTNSNVEPITSHVPIAVETPDRYIHLGERIFFPECLYPGHGDVVVEIVADGRTIYLDKAKYDGATVLGVERCENGYQIDRIVT